MFPINKHRQRLKRIRILLAELDHRSGSLVQEVLRGLGFEHIETVQDGESALRVLQEKPIDLIITEWHLPSFDGITLAQQVRTRRSGQRWERDIPIIMLTGNADMESVERARDHGCTEFVAKPFSAETLSNRLIQVIDHPRPFVVSEQFNGPCRRRKGDGSPLPDGERRNVFGGRVRHTQQVAIVPPSRKLAKLIGDDLRAHEAFSYELIDQAQQQLMRQESSFLAWAEDDLRHIDAAYAQLRLSPSDAEARQKLLAAAYNIKSQAGMFGYVMGTEVSRMLLDFMSDDRMLDDRSLVVLHKYIEAIRVVFQHKVKDEGGTIGTELIKSLHVLTAKLG